MTVDRIRRAVTAVTALSVVAGVWAGLPGGLPAASADDATEPRDGLVAEYLLDQTAGTVVPNTADDSDAAGDPMDAALRQGSDALWGDGGLTFTGGAKASGSWVELPDDVLAGQESATISTELWADPAMLNGFHFLWNIGNDATDSYLFASLNCANNRRTLVGIKSAGTEPLVQAPTCATTAERWTSLTVSVDGGADQAKVYVDGELVATGAMPFSPADVADQTLNTLGRAPWPDPLFKGRIGAFRIYDRALSDTEIAAVSDADAVEHAADLQAEAEALVAGLEDRTVDGDFTLPTGGGALTWTSSDPAVVSTTGEVTQPAHGADQVEVTLTAHADVRGQTAEGSITVTVQPEAAADEDYGYAMVHFIEDSQGYAEKIYLDVSRGDDPTHWLPLNDGKPILASNLGTTGVRDPYLTQNPETGTYYIIATDLRVFGGDNAGWSEWSRRGSRYLNIWESTDLVDWGQPRRLLVSPPTAGMSWAPEATWVPSLGKFVVYWSSTLFAEDDTNHSGATYSRIVYGTTSDFETDFAYQGVMIDSGSDVIDTTVIQDGDATYRISKDNGSGRGIFMERTTASDWWLPTTSWSQLQTSIGQADYGSVEGPAVFKDHDRDHWYLYVDVIPSIGYRPYGTTDLDAGWNKVDVAGSGFTMTPSTKHGGIIGLTKGRYDDVRRADVDELVTQEVTAATTAGTVPALPETATVRLENGREAEVPVVWDEVDPAAYDLAGEVVVEGRVKAIGNNLNESSGADVPLSSSTAIDNVVTATVTVAKAATKVRAVPTARTVRSGRRVALRVTVTSALRTPTGLVTIRDRGRKVRTVRVAGGTTRVRLVLRGAGKHRLKAAYAGNVWAAPSSATTTVRVVKRSR